MMIYPTLDRSIGKMQLPKLQPLAGAAPRRQARWSQLRMSPHVGPPGIADQHRET